VAVVVEEEEVEEEVAQEVAQWRRVRGPPGGPPLRSGGLSQNRTPRTATCPGVDSSTAS